MKIHGMRSMLGALSSAAVITTIIISPVALAQSGSQHKYSDDAIVRDLKAGKLTVREAQILQNRRQQEAARAADASEKKPALKAKSANPAKPARDGKAKPAHADKARKAGKAAKTSKAKPARSGQAGKAVKPGSHKPVSKAPIRHLTTPHAKPGARLVHTNAAHKSDGKPAPVRKTAVKYIR